MGAASDEWYSPSTVVEPARRLMRAIDLDPASCAEAQTVIKADRYYTVDDDGLAQPWNGRIWCNPPYSNVAAWVAKLIEEHESGRLTAAVLLTNASTDARWYAALAGRYPVLLTKGRIRFRHPDRAGASPRFGSALFGVGVEAGRFAAAYAGLVVEPFAPSVPRTNAEKRAAVAAMLADPMLSGWSDGEIARRCHVNQSTVTRRRASLMQCMGEDEPRTRIYVTKHGTRATMRTGGIGRRPKRGDDDEIAALAAD